MTRVPRLLLRTWAVISIPALAILAVWAVNTRHQLDQVERYRPQARNWADAMRYTQQGNAVPPPASFKWTPALLDSLSRSVQLMPPPSIAAGREASWYAMLATGTETDARFWYNEARASRSLGHTLLTMLDTVALKDRGLAAPAESIRADLVRHREFLPQRPYLRSSGSRFLPEEIILLPGGRWVCAHYEGDGGSGELLLEYVVDRKGHIRWKRLASEGN